MWKLILHSKVIVSYRFILANCWTIRRSISGETKNKSRALLPNALLSVVQILDWLLRYILARSRLVDPHGLLLTKDISYLSTAKTLGHIAFVEGFCDDARQGWIIAVLAWPQGVVLLFLDARYEAFRLRQERLLLGSHLLYWKCTGLIGAWTHMRAIKDISHVFFCSLATAKSLKLGIALLPQKTRLRVDICIVAWPGARHLVHH